MARALIADPDMPRKLLGGRAADIRPCVACNEDCRAFDPVLLCSVNPELGPPGADRRPAAPLVVRRAAEPAGGRVAIVGAGPAGLECAFTLAGRREVVLFDAREAIGGQLAVAAAAPHRRGWRALLDFYAAALELADGVELRLGTPVARGRPRRLRRGGDRDRQHRAPAGPAGHRARAAVVVCDRPAPERAQPAGRRRRVRLVAVRERRRARRPRGLRDDHGGDAGRGLRGLAAPGGPRAAARAPARRSARGAPVHGARQPRRGQRGAEEHDVRQRGARAADTRHRGRRARRARLERAGPGRGHRPRDRRRARAAQGVARDRRGPRRRRVDRHARPRAAAIVGTA